MKKQIFTIVFLCFQIVFWGSGASFGNDTAIKCELIELEAQNVAAVLAMYFIDPSKTEIPTPEELKQLFEEEDFKVTYEIAIEKDGEDILVIVKDGTNQCPKGSLYRYSAVSGQGEWQK